MTGTTTPTTRPGRPLRVLILEDEPLDAELLLAELVRQGFAPVAERVETEEEYLAQLDPALDLVVADYTLPRFDGMRALHLLRERALDIPLIFVTGTIGEEFAVSALKAGAADLVLKGSLRGLGAAVERALESRRLRDRMRQAEVVLRESEMRFRILSELTSDFTYALRVEDGATLRLEWATGSISELTGYTPDEMAPQGAMTTLLHPEDRPIVARHVERLLSGQADVAEMRIVSRDGEVRWIRDHAQPAWDAVRHRVAWIYGAVKDVTERKRAAEALREQEEAARELVRFVAGLTHELRTPLNAITGYTGLLLEGDFGALTVEQANVLRQVDEAAQEMLERVARIPDLRRGGASPAAAVATRRDTPEGGGEATGGGRR